MKHIRISKEDGGGNPIPPKTISEGEGMEEFKQNAFSYNTDNKSRIALNVE